MRAIYINVEDREITEIEITDDYRDLYKWIKCNMFQTCWNNDEGDAAFCDEAGTFREMPQAGFMIRDQPQPIIGNAVVCGSDIDGDTVSAKVDLQEIKDKVEFGMVGRYEGD